jgi:hypothetical protein
VPWLHRRQPGLRLHRLRLHRLRFKQRRTRLAPLPSGHNLLAQLDLGLDPPDHLAARRARVRRPMEVARCRLPENRFRHRRDLSRRAAGQSLLHLECVARVRQAVRQDHRDVRAAQAERLAAPVRRQVALDQGWGRAPACRAALLVEPAGLVADLVALPEERVVVALEGRLVGADPEEASALLEQVLTAAVRRGPAEACEVVPAHVDDHRSVGVREGAVATWRSSSRSK